MSQPSSSAGQVESVQHTCARAQKVKMCLKKGQSSPLEASRHHLSLNCHMNFAEPLNKLIAEACWCQHATTKLPD